MQALNGGHVREFKGSGKTLLFAKLVLPPLKINRLFFRRLDKAVAQCHGQLSMYRHNRHPVSPLSTTLTSGTEIGSRTSRRAA